MSAYHQLFLILVLLLVQGIHTLNVVRNPSIDVRVAAVYSDYLDIITHKHKALRTGISVKADQYHHSIGAMMANTKQKHFMAFSADQLVGCADLVTLDTGNHYHVQNVVVNKDFRR